MRESIVKVLMNRDGLTKEEAIAQVNECHTDMMQRLADGEMPDDICEEYFGLEPDYLEDMLF